MSLASEQMVKEAEKRLRKAIEAEVRRALYCGRETEETTLYAEPPKRRPRPRIDFNAP